ncbi:MAG TPA: asparagine synthetase B, partial [Candidatus Latescibacteria bacterium]|nr:asparagine synthetase B [Candidatus Latescibacterota bacterium]
MNLLRRYRWIAFAMLLFCGAEVSRADKLLIPMDRTQTDHLKAYGVVFWSLQRGLSAEWLLNYRGGSFLLDYSDVIRAESQLRGVLSERIADADVAEIYGTIERENMEVIRLDKAPRIA